MPFKSSGRGAYGPQGQKVIKGPLAPVWVTSGTLTGAGTGAYSYQLVATDDSGDAPTYSLATGSLNPGLSLSSTGLISGTATGTTNTATFTVRATDVNGRFTDSETLTLVATLRTAATYTAAAALSLGSYVAGDVINFSYTGAPQQFNRFNATNFQVQLRGAGGGDGDNASRGSQGALATGRVVSNLVSTYYVYIGGTGTTNSTSGGGGTAGYNGGAFLYDSGNPSWFIAGSSGASDIRKTGGAWNDGTSLNSRIIVAGGGGSASRNGGSGTAGEGGHPSGGNGTAGGGGGTPGGGGTQTGGGSSPQQSGGFGYGGGYNGSFNNLGGGGGGGWYGGGAGGNHMGNGGGGSSYYNTSDVNTWSHTNGSRGVARYNGSGTITIITASV